MDFLYSTRRNKLHFEFICEERLDKALNGKQAFAEKSRSLEEESQLDAFQY